MVKKRITEHNLPTVSKQTAGGVTGAVIGGIVAGPVGAVAGGVAEALVGNSSAKGNEPIKKAVAQIRSVGMRSAKAIKAARSRHKSSPPKAPVTKKVATKATGTKDKENLDEEGFESKGCQGGCQNQGDHPAETHEEAIDVRFACVGKKFVRTRKAAGRSGICRFRQTKER